MVYTNVDECSFAKCPDCGEQEFIPRPHAWYRPECPSYEREQRIQKRLARAEKLIRDEEK